MYELFEPIFQLWHTPRVNYSTNKATNLDFFKLEASACIGNLAPIRHGSQLGVVATVLTVLSSAANIQWQSSQRDGWEHLCIAFTASCSHSVAGAIATPREKSTPGGCPPLLPFLHHPQSAHLSIHPELEKQQAARQPLQVKRASALYPGVVG